jgi:NAD(P)-dependent dehydrogenase (short-subunit alcohol dehydrogenase family)
LTERPVAIVTAAGKGIGAACARELARRGFSLSLMSLSGGAVKVAAELGCHGMTGSVLSQDDLGALVEATLSRHGRIDAVITNTVSPSWSTTPQVSPYEISPDGHLLDIPDEEWHAMLDGLLLTVVRMARLVTPQMQRQGSGAIVNVSGMGAAVPCIAYPFGATFRRALTGFTKLYAARYGRDGIRMNNILPGFIDNNEWSPALVQNIPMARPGTLDEVASAAVFLAGKESAYVTGQDILVDGGIVRGL